jgi:tRNA threonylcarbamoyladenosine biosynthesis protein TsaE
MEYVSKSPEETKTIAQSFMKELLEKTEKGPIIVELLGDLGAGKTTFMHGVGEFFSITKPLSSPTFVIQKNYSLDHTTFKNLVHIDAYRIETEKELATLKWGEYSNNKENIIFIEWSKNMKDGLGNTSARVSFEHIDDTTRTITISYA